jgi:hypothetical protein
MRLSGSIRPMIFGFILAIGITVTLPYIAFAAARSFGGSRPMVHRQHSFSHPFNRFNRFGFVGVGGVVVDEQPVIIIQQFQPAAAAQASEPAETRIYVQPRWVDVGLECRSYNQDTGQIRSKRKSADRGSGGGKRSSLVVLG